MARAWAGGGSRAWAASSAAAAAASWRQVSWMIIVRVLLKGLPTLALALAARCLWAPEAYQKEYRSAGSQEPLPRAVTNPI